MSPGPIIPERLNESSILNISSVLVTNSEFSTFYWCFESNSTSACCTCGEQCFENGWTTYLLDKNTCSSCEYRCLLTINPITMKYNGGKIISSLRYFGRNATLAVTQLEVIPLQTERPSKTRQSYRNYYLVGSGAGVAVIILLITVVVYKIKVHHKSRYLQLMSAEEQYIGKKIILFCSYTIV